MLIKSLNQILIKSNSLNEINNINIGSNDLYKNNNSKDSNSSQFVTKSILFFKPCYCF
ncbi:hypothetical protein RB653_002206 [Dictyostelium firmibasis]|uniref:Uncharacterized protein n=1 Tax=Dictyostelium firmibasis TaxID=79012 RepID=A0AAN7YYK1_9MYCE